MYSKLFMLLMAGMLMCPVVKAQERDWANFKRYEQQNTELKQQTSRERVVFMGNSITEGWANQHPDFFRNNGFVGRGISGQTSYQFLVRFREDVINLSPKVVVINAGTNDIAENTGAYVEARTLGNIISMVELAQANHIQVILTSVLPAAAFGWNQSVKDAPQKIQQLNAGIRAYAMQHQIPFVDYYAAMVAHDGKALKSEYTQDGVHPVSAGYDVMEQQILPVIHQLLNQQ